MSEEKKNKKEEGFVNPIDIDKVAENPGLLPYSHTVGGVAIKPVDTGKVKSRALSAMQEQTNTQLNQIKKQIELLAEQAKTIQKRIQVSNWIYSAETSFEPFIGHKYFLYRKHGEVFVLSMIGPKEWRKTIPYEEYIAEVQLLSDHTWKVVEDEEV